MSGPWTSRLKADTIPLPSLNFLLLTLIFTGTGAALWHGLVAGQGAVIVFVVSGWVVSLCLHEFAHALVAYHGGDHMIAETGYLTLDPLQYTDPLLSIALPLIYIALGGFGLPGGAVWIRHGLLRGPGWDSAVSAAGPAANALVLAGLAGLYALLPHGDRATDIEGAVALLAYFQATAIVLNLLPIPGLDGFGILRPWLPGHIAAAGNAIAAGAGFMLILLVISTPAIGHFIFMAGRHVTDLFGFDPYDISYGYRYLSLR